MKKSLYLLLVVVLFISTSCGNKKNTNPEADVKIETEFGDILIKLYDKTPKHRDNFIKLAKDGYYDGLLFHRVIQNFMIQGGDPDSKNAQPGQRLGNGDPGYTIPAEFDSTLFHKKGALAAAREPDEVNPEKASSGSQFYLVQGRKFNDQQIDELLQNMENRRTQEIMRKHFLPVQDELNKLRSESKQEELSMRVAEIREAADADVAQLKPLTISKEKREVYATLGGYPSLDGNYTVFGEIVEGLNVLDSIAAVKTDEFDRPVTDVKMKVKVLD